MKNTLHSTNKLEFIEKVPNQNLHGLTTPDMVILTPKEYISYAQSIARLHNENDGMEVAVIDHETVFNEFSSGTPDATAYRRLMKMWPRRRAFILVAFWKRIIR